MLKDHIQLAITGSGTSSQLQQSSAFSIPATAQAIKKFFLVASLCLSVCLLPWCFKTVVCLFSFPASCSDSISLVFLPIVEDQPLLSHVQLSGSSCLRTKFPPTVHQHLPRTPGQTELLIPDVTSLQSVDLLPSGPAEVLSPARAWEPFTRTAAGYRLMSSFAHLNGLRNCMSGHRSDLHHPALLLRRVRMTI